MNWLSIYKNGLPNRDQRVLTYSGKYKDIPEMAYRILEGKFVPMCGDVTHYALLRPPRIPQPGNAADTNSRAAD